MGSRILRTYSAKSLRRSALLRGAAQSFDLRGDTRRQYRVLPDPAQVDHEAVVSDWFAVGDDLRGAMARYSPSN